ncbi:DUF5995 family protein [Pseudonocardia ailaonensis]|uniref:DUF5995 family protein n=1 Tax=Pseudonocardia ailaonensis TaxID=367279 RepID=A0ABN2MM65_9PSEU
MGPGSASALAACCADDAQSIDEVVAQLEAVRDRAAEHPGREARDGIACFSRLYATITRNVGRTAAGQNPERRFADPDFITLLDLEFARRYFAAIRDYAGDGTVRSATPRAWWVLFARRDHDIPHANFAAAGVNAHVNFDLTFALLETWRKFPPTPARRADYDTINDIFADEMDGLRADFESWLSADGTDSVGDLVGNNGANLVVRLTRHLAWEKAEEIWERLPSTEHYDAAYSDSLRILDEHASWLGRAVLAAPVLPF